MQTITVKLPDALAVQLDQLVKQTERNKSYYIRRALQEFLEDSADAYIALERKQQRKRHFHSTEEVLKALRTKRKPSA